MDSPVSASRHTTPSTNVSHPSNYTASAFRPPSCIPCASSGLPHRFISDDSALDAPARQLGAISDLSATSRHSCGCLGDKDSMPQRRRAGKRGGSTQKTRRGSKSDEPDQHAATTDRGTGGSGSPMAETHDGPRVGDKDPGLQVIVLGSGGGPIEHNTTAFLVRSVASGWKRGSVIAVDAGVHLGAMARILESTQPQSLGSDVSLPHTLESGPFAGLEVRSPSAIANAAYITQSIIDTYLITHPHLDHISAFVVNTAGLNKPKKLAGLPSTISAFKTHIFNNIIWPNLSDENNGAGLVTYMRLVEGGSPAMGEGEEKGYMEVSDGLSVKICSVSHGHCIEKHSHRGSQSSQGGRYGSHDHISPSPMMRSHSHTHAPTSGSTPTLTPSRFPPHVNVSVPSMSPGGTRESICVYDSSAYFIRDQESGKEVLIFGDVEPDSVSLSPRNRGIWQEAAHKIASGALRGIFIECSYDNSQTIDRLFGHLKPSYVIEELKMLAEEVESYKKDVIRETKKRKRAESHGAGSRGGDGSLTLQNRKKVCDEPVSPKSMRPAPAQVVEMTEQVTDQDAKEQEAPPPSVVPSLEEDDTSGGLEQDDTSSFRPKHTGFALRGLKVVIMHVKDRISDGYPMGEKILQELREEEDIESLGCEFIVSRPGESVYL